MNAVSKFAALAAAGLLAAAPSLAQIPSQQPAAIMPIRFSSIPDSVALDVTREGFFTVTATGPVGVEISIKSVENLAFGGQQARALFSLVEPATTIAAPSGATSELRVSPTVIAKVNPTKGAGNFGGSDSKRVRFAGVPGASPIPKVVSIVLEASGGGGRPVTETVNVLLGGDSGPPVIKFAGGSASDHDKFPPLRAGSANNNDWNIVQTHMEIQIDADNFTVPTPPSVEVLELYHVIAEYADGARFKVSFRPDPEATNVSAGATRIIATVPNINRGGFRIQLATPAGVARDTRQFTFPASLFTTHPVGGCNITLVGVDVPGTKPSENGFWVPVSFEPPALPATASCNKPYGKWRDMDIESTTMTPVGAASSKFTRKPAVGSIAHNGNMPAFSCSAAGIGYTSIHWRAKIDIFVGECPEKRVQ